MAVYVSNITIPIGSDFEQTFSIENVNDTPLNLTVYTGAAALKKHPASLTITAPFEVSFPDRVNGKVKISLGSSITSSIRPGRYSYDLVLFDGSKTSRVIEGSALVTPGVTVSGGSTVSYSSSYSIGGSQGIQGITGFQGIQGTSGEAVFQGLQGIQGSAGILGSQGIQGTQGVQGTQGIQGNTGAGTQGIQGAQGVQGTQGIQGNTGAGTQGIQGLQGNLGLQGTQGIQGNDGTASFQGIQGIQGTQGTIGQIPVAKTYIVTVSNGVYYIDGIQQDTLYLLRGQRYILNQTSISNSGHPIGISTVSDGTHNSGTQYTDGWQYIGFSGSDGYGIFDVPAYAPDTLYYYCQIHPGMGGTIQIKTLTSDSLIGSQGIQGIQGQSGSASFQGIQGIQGFSGAVGLSSRSILTASTGVLGIGATTNLEITGYKSYLLQKIETSAGSWITIYTDSTSRTSDSTRDRDTDPLPGSGVISEFISTSYTSQKFTPGVIGFNDDAPPSDQMYLKVVNNSGVSTDISLSLTVLKLEI